MAMSNMTKGPRIHWMAYFWPGLPQLWTRGSWAGLLVAVGFTALANVLLLATFLFREWLKLETRLLVLAALTIVWLVARWQSRAQRRVNLAVEDDPQLYDGEAEPLPTERDLLFREAQGHYIRNDWVATEQLLLRLLKQDARDVESRLMLATLWRHQGRLAEATRQLDRLQRLEAAEDWQHEIDAERVAISAANNIELEGNLQGDLEHSTEEHSSEDHSTEEHSSEVDSSEDHSSEDHSSEDHSSEVDNGADPPKRTDATEDSSFPDEDDNRLAA